MFADASVAARIDRAEGRMCAHIADSIRAGKPQSPAFVLPVSGGQAIYIGPGSPVNKVIGLGLDCDLDIAALERVERAWRDRGEPVRIELSVLADPSFGSTLTERGYKLHGFENVLGRALDGQSPAANIDGIDVDVVTDSHVDTWVDIAVEAFTNLDGTGSVAPDSMSADHLKGVFKEMLDVPGFTRYVARINGDPIGEAAMRIEGDLAQLAGAGTRPRGRGRGVQKALLHRRLLDAAAAGCTVAVVTTAPGTRSQENVMRRGFDLLYARAILLK